MLVVANGAFKSGSSWLFQILRLLTAFGPPPEKYCNPEWLNPSIHPDSLRDFICDGSFHRENYLCKNHFGRPSQRDLLLSTPDVWAFGIERDLRDVVVSAYYHDQRIMGYAKTFSEYYWEIGRYVVADVRIYNTVWNCPSSQVCISRYETLLSDFTAEVKRIAGQLSMELAPETLLKMQETTDFANWKSRAENPHLRKGIQGDWKNHLDERMLRDIELIQAAPQPDLSKSMKQLTS